MSYGHKFQIFLLLVLGSCYICVLDHHSNSALVNIRPPSLQRGLSLSDPSNPILLPPRLTYCTVNKTEGGPSIPQQEGKRTRVGCSFSPLEINWTFCYCFSHDLFLNSPLRVVTENPWRCFSTLWTNTGQERGPCTITTTSCVRWSLAPRNVTSDYRPLW